jgi:hypothetical protein
VGETFGTHLAARVGQKHLLRRDSDVAAVALKGLGNNLAVLQQHKLWVDGNVTPHRTPATAHVGGDSAVAQTHEGGRGELDIATVGLRRQGRHATIGAQKRIPGSKRDIPSIACPAAFTGAFSSNDGPVAELDLARLEGDIPTPASARCTRSKATI